MYTQHIVIDFEMNPVSRCKGKNEKKRISREIIEIGAVKLNAVYEVVDYFECLVRPQYNREIARFITELTGIQTPQVMKSEGLEIAVMKLGTWIGEEKTRVYSWSNTDLCQLKKECSLKSIAIPVNMSRWLDFQLIFPRIMKIEGRKRMSLKDAADWYGLTIDSKSSHRALYDAKITSDLVRVALTGEYKKQISLLHEIQDESYMDSTLGEMFGKMFSQFVSKNGEVRYA